MSRENMWAAIEFLISLGAKSELLFFDDTDDWLNNFLYKIRVKAAQKRIADDYLNRRFSVEEDMSHFTKFFRSSIGRQVVKTKLEMLLDSNIVRLTDRKYMMKLMTKLTDSHEKQQQKRIEGRKKQELMRTKNMILNRLIPVQEAPIELRQYPLFKLYLHCDALIEKKRRARIPKKVQMSHSLYKSLYLEKEKDATKSEENYEIEREYCESENMMCQEELSKINAEQEAPNDIQDNYMMSQENYDRLHYEADSVKSLREAQTVDELYKRAFEIIGILCSDMDKE